MNRERILGAAAVVGILATSGASIKVWQISDEIGRELDDRVTQALPNPYSPEELLGYRLTMSQYDQAVAGGNNQVVENMRMSGEIDTARKRVENNQLLQTERGRLRIELSREDSGILGTSKSWMQIIGRLAIAVPLSYIAGGIGAFFASRQTGLNNPSTHKIVPGISI